MTANGKMGELWGPWPLAGYAGRKKVKKSHPPISEDANLHRKPGYARDLITELMHGKENPKNMNLYRDS